MSQSLIEEYRSQFGAWSEPGQVRRLAMAASCNPSLSPGLMPNAFHELRTDFVVMSRIAGISLNNMLSNISSLHFQ